MSKFWHHLSSFITTLWDSVNYKFIQLLDLKNSCGCIPGYQARKGLHTGQLKLTHNHVNFVILNNSCVKVIFRQLKKNIKLGNSCIGFFQTQENLQYIKWHLSGNLLYISKFVEKYNTINCWKVWKYYFISRQFY